MVTVWASIRKPNGGSQFTRKAVTAMETKKQKSIPLFIHGVFWFAFMALLATSIPHMAWTFHQYETGETLVLPWVNWDVSWTINVALATGIDAAIASLAYTLEVGLVKFNQFLVWTFTILLSSLSWYMNYLYEIAHKPVTSPVWELVIPGGMTTGDITPFLTSAMPVYILAFTLVMQVIGGRTQVTTEELQEQLNTVQNINSLKSQVKAAKRQNFVNSLQGIVKDASSVVTTAKTAFTQEAPTMQNTALPEAEGVNVPTQEKEAPTAQAEAQESTVHRDTEELPKQGTQGQAKDTSLFGQFYEGVYTAQEQEKAQAEKTLEVFTVETPVPVTNGNGNGQVKRYRRRTS